jgi:hypothetical protein
MDQLSLISFDQICHSLYTSVEKKHHSSAPYNPTEIEYRWKQWFPPSIYSLCQEIALEGRYVNFDECIRVTLYTKTDVLSFLELCEYPGHMQFLDKVHRMNRSRVAYVWSGQIRPESSSAIGLVFWSCHYVHVWSSRMVLTCHVGVVF